ncbi:ZIP zinc/iron transport family [Basidiobolus meristosporus CBS 931.73]|uniref:ZIP zinc/iron transport family n=1 Tax=Basidiobolus meristosporus CBS 931.73 TaxID=1314790 RepID=A0A1Y1YZN9_9FUNG|nr:ZIP zinc/iron transport family [Basidiobolus meristosporus CBS 931.73]|eukprot:ORY03508.1 ZIP zinc/iron transport family [Basidiobolus meristosporus CBS 931.73]
MPKTSLLPILSLIFFSVAPVSSQEVTIVPKHAGPSHEHEHESDGCSAGDAGNYNMPLHVAAIFIILIASALGVFSSLLASRFKHISKGRNFVTLGKHFGTGVILATGFIHMFPGALFALTNPCVPEAFHENYTAYAGLFAMFGALILQLIEFTASQHFGKAQTSDSVDSNSEDTLSVEREPSGVLEKTHNLESGHGGCHHGGLIDADQQRRISTYLLEFGISMHSVLIGISVGVTSGTEFNSLLCAIVFHQFFEGLALGARIGELTYSNRLVPYITAMFYAVITPIGVAIGLGIHSSYNENSPTALLVNGIFDAVSAGILIYMAFVNLIAVEFQNSPEFIKQSKLMKVTCYIALWTGAGIMALIGRWA